MHKNTIKIVIWSMTLSLAACAGQVSNKQNSKTIAADSSSINDETTKIYCRAISDYITEVSNQKLMVLDTLFFGKRNNGQPDDFPDILLPEAINNIKIRLIDPKIGEALQAEKKSRVYINLVGWIEKDNAQFIFVTFSNGLEHQFDCHLEYKYNSDRKEFDLMKTLIERFNKQ
jgi:hypothetical protein